jgi:hypothetical protein
MDEVPASQLTESAQNARRWRNAAECAGYSEDADRTK